MQSRGLEIAVGFFVLLAIVGLLFLAFKVSGLTNLTDGHHYSVTADFENIGDLKIRAPVTVSGVKVGRVSSILLDPNSFRATVTLEIDDRYHALPIDTSASIFTQGLLGSNYIGIDISAQYISDAEKRIKNAMSEQEILEKELAKHIVIKTFSDRKKEGQFTGKFKKSYSPLARLF